MDAPEILTTASLRRTALVYVTVLLSAIGLAASAFAYLYARARRAPILDLAPPPVSVSCSPASVPAF